MATPERRKKPRVNAHLLASFRCLDKDQVTLSGFVRTLNLSEEGALLESPDPFPIGQLLNLEFLMDYDRVASVEATVNRVTRNKEMYRVAVKFTNLSQANRRLLAKQVSA